MVSFLLVLEDEEAEEKKIIVSSRVSACITIKTLFLRLNNSVLKIFFFVVFFFVFPQDYYAS